MSSTSIDNWIQVIVPDEPHKLDRRLEWDGLNKDDFGSWLESECSYSDSETYANKAALQEACDVLKLRWDTPLLPYDNKENRPFVDLWWPVRCHIFEKLKHEEAFISSKNLIADNALEQLADTLVDRLC